MSPRIIALEGPDGVGKSWHTDALAASLRERGFDVWNFHHEKPAATDPFIAALDYARQRRELWFHTDAGAVVVADRWWHSTLVAGWEIADTQVHRALRQLAIAEGMVTVPLLVLALTAPDAVLDARLSARGAPPTPEERAARMTYREVLSTPAPPRIDTARPREVVAAEILAHALRALGRDA